MSKILCSTGALIGRWNNRDYNLLESLSKELECDGFEFMMYSTWYEDVDDIIRALLRTKRDIPVMHCEKHIGESISKGGKEELARAYQLFEINCKMAQRIGADKLVIHLWDGLTSDANFQNNLEAYFYLNDMAVKHGLDLLVENVVCNVENPMKHWCELRERYPEIHFVFDTKMAAFHEQTELLYESEYAWLWKENHIVHYHINDYAGGYMDWKNLRTLPIGKGKVDFERLFDHIHKTGYQGKFTVEATAGQSDGTVDIAMLNEQFRYIKDAMDSRLVNR